MTDTTLLLGSVRCTQDPENDRRWYYVPTTPQPERTPDGLPTAALIDLGTRSSLQVGAQLGLDADDVAALRDALSRELNRPERDLEVSPLVVEVATVELRLDAGADGADVSVLARSSSSGYPPYTAVLHAMVEGYIRRLVLDAIAGGTASLEVAYVVAPVATPASTSTRFSHTFERSSMASTSSSTPRGGSSSTERVVTTGEAEVHRRGGGIAADQGDGEVVAADIASWFAPRSDRPNR